MSRAYTGGTRTNAIEQRVMDYWDQGMSADAAAKATSAELGCTEYAAKNALRWMREGLADKPHNRIAEASAMLAARTLAVHGPGAMA